MELRDEKDPIETPSEESDRVYSNPETRVETDKNIWWNKPTISRGNDHQFFWQLWILLQKCRTWTIKGETPRTEQTPWYFSEGPRCWMMHIVKQNKSCQWEDATRAGHRRIIMGVEDASPTNTKKGDSDKRKIKYAYHPRNTSAGENKFTSPCPHMNLR